MKKVYRVEVLGDSVLKGIQINPVNLKYYIKNDFGFEKLIKKYNIDIVNNSRFGCTVIKGAKVIKKNLELGFSPDAVVMDFGGNDCDYEWSEIAKKPDNIFIPKTPIDNFKREYRNIISLLRDHGILPILTTLPPIDAQRFFEWWCKDLNKGNVLRWLGSIDHIYQHHEEYSKVVEQIAIEEQVPLVDIRSAFLSHGQTADLLCEDGTHPNSKGQRVITETFEKFLSHQQIELLG